MRTSLLLALATSLFLSLTALGCGSASNEDTGESSSSVSTRRGVDYSWSRPSPEALHRAGYTFACRYLSWDTTGKNLSAGEAKALIAAGVDVVSNWENSATDALGGYGQGVSDAKEADRQAREDGMPSDRPIYFSIDFDAQPGDQGAIDAYYDGVASVIGRDRTGAYGGFYVIERLFNAGKIKWAWQTYAWSGGQWDSRAQLRQVQNDVTVPGACGPNECDEDQAVAADFGQWGHPTGAPTPKPPRPTGCKTINPGEGLSAGESFASCDGRITLAMQNDGNLVLYLTGGEPLWATSTNGTDGFVAVMQKDGNFVLYGRHSNPLWASGTNRHDGASLDVQDDGNLVVYGPNSGPALWASGTDLPAGPPEPTGCGTIHKGEGLTAGHGFKSCDGRFSLDMQTDGNLVLYEHGVGALWATRTNDHGYLAVMQDDGNFVVYDRSMRPHWASNTNDHAGSDLVLQNDGNLVVYGPGGHPLWASNTCCR